MGTVASTRIYRNNPPLNTGEGLEILRNNQIAFRELTGVLPPVTVTSISNNTLNPTSTTIIVNTNATINTITSTVNLSGETTTDNTQAEQEFHDGAVIKLIASSGKTVTLGNSGNIQLLDNASSVTISSTVPTVLTYKTSTHKWVEYERTSELVGGIVGNLSSLTTTAKNTVVAAINEVKSDSNTNATNHTTLLNAVGNIAKSGNSISAISSQITRTSIIAAINDLVSKIGLPLSGLTTSVKSSVVAAINSLVSGKADKTEVGTLSSLTTATKTSAVAAINELKSTYDSNIGTLANLTTTNKDSLVSAINETNTGVVHTSGNESIAGTKTFTGSIAIPSITFTGNRNFTLSSEGTDAGAYLKLKSVVTGKSIKIFNGDTETIELKTAGDISTPGSITATNGFVGNVTGTASKATNDVDGNAIKTTYAKLASPTFTGTPKAPTASASTNNTQIATTAFVKTAISNVAHKTGDEEIAGNKTFTNNVILDNTVLDLSTTSSTTRELYPMQMKRNPADTTHGGGIFQIGAAQSANSKNFTAVLRVLNPRGNGNYPASSANGENTGPCWGGIGVFYDYDKNRAYPAGSGLSRWAANDSNDQHLASTSWVRTATGLNAESASRLQATITEGSYVDILATYRSESTNASERGCSIRCYNNNGSNEMYLGVHDESNSAAQGILIRNTNGTVIATAPSTLGTRTNGTDIITRDYLDNHKIEKTYWRSRELNRSIAEAITATSTTPYTLTTTDFGSDYKEILFKFVHTSAQSAAAAFKLKVYFSDNNTALAQINNFFSTAANNYTYLKIINNFGLAECYSMRATSGSLGTWNSLAGNTGTVLPSIIDPDATITKVELYSSSSSVTQIPSGFSMYSWGRK